MWIGRVLINLHLYLMPHVDKPYPLFEKKGYGKSGNLNDNVLGQGRLAKVGN